MLKYSKTKCKIKKNKFNSKFKPKTKFKQSLYKKCNNNRNLTKMFNLSGGSASADVLKKLREVDAAFQQKYLKIVAHMRLNGPYYVYNETQYYENKNVCDILYTYTFESSEIKFKIRIEKDNPKKTLIISFDETPTKLYDESYIMIDQEINKLNKIPILEDPYINPIFLPPPDIRLLNTIERIIQKMVYSSNIDKYMKAIVETYKQRLVKTTNIERIIANESAAGVSAKASANASVDESFKYLVLGANPWQDLCTDKQKIKTESESESEYSRKLSDDTSIFMCDNLWDFSNRPDKYLYNYDDISNKYIDMYKNIIGISKSCFTDKSLEFHNNLLSRFFQINLNNIVEINIISKILEGKFTAIFFDISVIKFLLSQPKFGERIVLLSKMLTPYGVIYINIKDSKDHYTTYLSPGDDQITLTTSIKNAGCNITTSIYYPSAQIVNEKIKRDEHIINKIYPIILQSKKNYKLSDSNSRFWLYTKFDDTSDPPKDTVSVLIVSPPQLL